MEIDTPLGKMTLPDSVRAHKQEKLVIKNFVSKSGVRSQLQINIRWDDCCRNGKNTLSITGSLLEPDSLGQLREVAGGCLHEDIAENAPELKFALPYHLVSADGPLHYFVNTTFLAGDRDCWGWRKDEHTKSKNGNFLWQRAHPPFIRVETPTDTPPAPEIVQYAPVLGEGKLPDFEAARRAVDLLDLTDEELSLEPSALRSLLLARTSDMAPVQIENAVYHAGSRDFHGALAGEQRKGKGGLLVWVAPGFGIVESEQCPEDITIPFSPRLGKGKERELDLARGVAIWPEASDEELMQPTEVLERALAARLPTLMQSFKEVVEKLGFTY